MVFPCAMGRWSWWRLQSETIPMAHEVMGYAVSPDAITMTAPVSRKCVAMECFTQWHVRFSSDSPACSLNVATTLSAWCGENLRGSCTKFFEGAFPSCILLFSLAWCCTHHAPHSPLAVSRCAVASGGSSPDRGGAGRVSEGEELSVVGRSQSSFASQFPAPVANALFSP